MKKFLLIFLAMAGMGARAVTILQHYNPTSDVNQSMTVGQAAWAIGWVQSQGLQNVSISAPLVYVQGPKEFTPAPNMQVWLMNQIGAGTTAANEVATTQVLATLTSNASFTTNFINLFSGLSLPAGNYFLVISPQSGDGIWQGATFPNTSIQNPAVTSSSDYGTPLLGGSFNGAYAPGSTFVAGNRNLEILVTGDIVPQIDNGVPEPSSFLLLGLALPLVFRRRLS